MTRLEVESQVSDALHHSAVSVKIPPFWLNDPALWFLQFEAQFSLKNISSQLTKFHYIVSSLEPQVALHVRTLILNPPAADPYDALKTALLQSFTPSDQSRLQQLFSTNSLGDMKPTELYLRIQRLLGDSVVDETILRNLFLLRLPVFIRTSLAAMQDKPLSQLVQIADTLVEIATPSIAALRPTPRTQSTCESCTRLARELEHIQSKLLALEEAVKPQTQLRVARTRSPSPYPMVSSSPSRQEVCWYHDRFGSKATKCQPPCKFSLN